MVLSLTQQLPHSLLYKPHIPLTWHCTQQFQRHILGFDSEFCNITLSLPTDRKLLVIAFFELCSSPKHFNNVYLYPASDTAKSPLAVCAHDIFFSF